MPRSRHDPSKDLVGFLVGDVMYAVRIEVVREVVRPLAIEDIPRAPAAVRGVAGYRGEVVPVIDLRERFGLPPAAPATKARWIVLRVGGASGARHAALVVDAVTDVFGLAGGELRAAPPLGSGDAARAIEGVTTLGSRLVFVLDARAFGAVTEQALGYPGDAEGTLA